MATTFAKGCRSPKTSSPPGAYHGGRANRFYQEREARDLQTGDLREGNPAVAEQLRSLILRLAAYRATHAGRDPPENSALANEKERLRGQLPRRFAFLGRLLRPWRRHPPLRVRPRPLRPYLVERSFLTDDHSEAEVVKRLEAWPMVTAYRPEGRVFTGEWFSYTVEVRAESARQARFLVECMFAPGQGSPSRREDRVDPGCADDGLIPPA